MLRRLLLGISLLAPLVALTSTVTSARVSSARPLATWVTPKRPIPTPAPHPPESTRVDSMGPVVEGSVLGTPGKNIWASWDGDTLLAVYGTPSGQGARLSVAYSFDAGRTWQTAIMGPAAPGRLCPGITSPPDSIVPYMAYERADSMLGSVYFTKDELFPFFFYSPVLVDTPGFMPAITTAGKGDTVLISYSWPSWLGLDGNVYLRRSFDGGLTWSPRILMVDTQGNPAYDEADAPRIQLAEGGYVFALFNWCPVGTDRWIPFYTESMDCGATWSTPQMVFPSWPPYPDAKCWWYAYDVVLEVIGDHRPHCGIKLGTQNYEFGDIWECHPTGGTPGNWTDWVANLLMGDGAGGNYATFPSIARTSEAEIVTTFSAFWIHSPTDTFADIGLCYSLDAGSTWSPPEPITRDEPHERAIETADNKGDELHLVCVKDDCLWHVATPNPATGVEEQESGIWHPATGNCSLHTFPNPFGPGGTIISFNVERSTLHVSLRVYDLAGRLVRTLVDDTQEPGLHQVVWHGSDDAGSRLPTGVYLCRLTWGDLQSTRKLIILK